MKAKILFMGLFLWGCALTPTHAQAGFPYPSLPDTLHTVEQRANYLCEHYWDHFNFADTLQLNTKEMAEQGFVNFIDILARFSEETARKGIAAFTGKAFSNKASKDKFESLIERYYEDSGSPMRNDKVYSLFLENMAQLPYFDETEKERIAFRYKAAHKHLPGSIATDFTFPLEDGKMHRLSDYQDQKVILYFYDPDCENCHQTTAWLNKQAIPTDITLLRIMADTQMGTLYSLKAMPTIYLLDKGNQVILKECTAEQLVQQIHPK